MSVLEVLTIRTCKTKASTTAQARSNLEAINQKVTDLCAVLPGMYPQLDEKRIHLFLSRPGSVWDSVPRGSAPRNQAPMEARRHATMETSRHALRGNVRKGRKGGM